MASQGPNNPGTVAQEGPGTSWINLANVQTSDNIYATIDLMNLTVCRLIKGTNYGFSIPAGATINGILVTIERKAASASRVSDLNVYLIKAGVAQSAEDKASAGFWAITDESVNYGGVSDLWSNTWTVDDINSADFGVGLRAQQVVDEFDVTASVDWMGITVYYTEVSSEASAGQLLKKQSQFLKIGDRLLKWRK